MGGCERVFPRAGSGPRNQQGSEDRNDASEDRTRSPTCGGCNPSDSRTVQSEAACRQECAWGPVLFVERVAECNWLRFFNGTDTSTSDNTWPGFGTKECSRDGWFTAPTRGLRQS